MKKTNMKQLITLVTVALFCFSVNTEAQTTWGITAGMTFANAKLKEGTESKTSDSKTGFSAGLIIDIPAGKSFSIQPGLQFLQKGFSDKTPNSSEKVTLNYIDLPINAIYSSAKGFFVGAGPAFGFGISGKDKYTIGTVSETTDMNFGSKEGELKTIEMSANVLTGFNFKKGFMIAANYNVGLTNLSNEKDVSFKNSYFGLKLGWMIKSKKA